MESLRGDVPAPLARLVASLLAKPRELRPATAAEVADALRAASGEGGGGGAEGPSEGVAPGVPAPGGPDRAGAGPDGPDHRAPDPTPIRIPVAEATPDAVPDAAPGAGGTAGPGSDRGPDPGSVAWADGGRAGPATLVAPPTVTGTTARPTTGPTADASAHASVRAEVPEAPEERAGGAPETRDRSPHELLDEAMKEALRTGREEAPRAVATLARGGSVAARFDRELSGALFGAAEWYAWSTAAGDGTTAAALLTLLAEGVAAAAPARAGRLLARAEQALFPAPPDARAVGLARIARAMAPVSPERAALLAERHPRPPEPHPSPATDDRGTDPGGDTGRNTGSGTATDTAGTRPASTASTPAARAAALVATAAELSARDSAGAVPTEPDPDPGPDLPEELTRVRVPAAETPGPPPGGAAGPAGARRWQVPVVPDTLGPAGDRLVWSDGAETGAVRADTGHPLWTAHGDAGVAAPALPEPVDLRSAVGPTGTGTVAVALAPAGRPLVRVLVREARDGRVRWWRDLPGAPSTVRPPLRVAGDLVLYAGHEALSALDAETGETVWRLPGPFDASLVTTVREDCLVLADAAGLRGLRLPDGAPLWTRTRNEAPPRTAADPPSALPLPSGPVHLADGTVLRALDAGSGRTLWRHAAGPLAPRLVVPGTAGRRSSQGPWGPGGPVFAAARLPAEGADAVLALDADTGALLWQRRSTRHDGSRCALELLGLRGGLLYVKATRGGRGRLGRPLPPFVEALDPATGKPRFHWAHPSLTPGPTTLLDTLAALPLPSLTAITLP
ncbi:PQQ-binding-like beta-propeller repeat protein [Streptomyces sp. NPDC097619]|uniref:outer membrane protein assembly factor BamB family protein n=1 Tax=Streptomyces sp. NPDC097619 TaxID=3157228 RepID=UPI0033237256